MLFKRWFESKTVWLNILTALAGIIQLVTEFLNGADLSVEAIFMLFVGIAVFSLPKFLLSKNS